MSPPRIQKFSSRLLGDAAGWRAAARVAAEAAEGGSVAVVSVPAGLRTGLAAALDAAGRGEGAAAAAGCRRLLEDVESLGRDLGLEGGLPPSAEPLVTRLTELVQGACLVGHASPRTRDAVLGLAGGLGAVLFTALLGVRGARARAARGLPAAAGPHGAARPLPAIRWMEKPSRGEILVLPGGFGEDADGSVRAYGPGGSDLTAVALGAGWGASEVRIWTADDGIQSADPSLVPGARPLSRLSYGEARALSAFGDRALHPDVLAVASEAGLDLVLANLHRPGRRTRITVEAPSRPPGSVASVAYKEGLHLLRLPPAASLEGMAGADAELRAAGAQRLGAIAGPEGFLLALRADGAAAVQHLAALADRGAELSAGWALVALVGEGLRATPGAALRLLAPFHRETVGGLLAGSSPISVSFLVPEERLGELVPRLHHRWIERWIEAAEPSRVLAPLAL